MYPQPNYQLGGQGMQPAGQFVPGTNPGQVNGHYAPQQLPNSAYYGPTHQPQQPIFVQPGYGAQQQQSGIPFQAGHDLNFLLRPLIGLDRAIIKQKKEMLEIFTNWETNNRYEIYNGSGQVIYYAFEDTSALNMCCFGENRPFCIRVIDFQGQQVMVVNSSIDFCTREVTVQVPAGRIVANIFQEFAFFTPSFYINDAAGGLIFKIKSPMMAAIGSLSNVNFDVLSSDQRTIVGQISKQWGGLMRELFTDADTFGVSFPPDMDATWKAVLLAVTFVVDFEFYEKSHR